MQGGFAVVRRVSAVVCRVALCDVLWMPLRHVAKASTTRHGCGYDASWNGFSQEREYLWLEGDVWVAQIALSDAEKTADGRLP